MVVPAVVVGGAAGATALAVFIGAVAMKSMASTSSARLTPPPKPSPWPSLRRRAKALLSEAYGEAVTEVVTVAHNLLPVAVPGVPSFGARLANILLAWIAVFVAGIGRVERMLGYAGGLPVHVIREATLDEMRAGLGRLNEKHLLPSAYEVWVGPRTQGNLALRYTYHANRLKAQLVGTAGAARAECVPLQIDDETIEWVRSHVVSPAPPSRLHVWRALKRRLYHYDAGVVAFRGFPRNFLLSSAQWGELLDRPTGGVGTNGGIKGGIALDIGAGDGSLNEPMRQLFGRVVATELTLPLVLRLRDVGLDGVLAEEVLPQHVLSHLPNVERFDAVLILNVLDRCKDPFAMLAQAKALLAPGGKLVISVVLPASQSDAALGVGFSQRRWNVDGDTFEAAAASLVQHVLLPSGFEPLRIVRAPYFCAGDRNSPVAALDACIIVLQATGAGGGAAAAGNEEEASDDCARSATSDD